jgi:flagellin
MSLVIGTNTSAQYAQEGLRVNQRKSDTAMDRLSTGIRINSAKDDAAGLAISQKMTTQINGLNQAVRNINDGISLLQTAEGSLNSVTDMLQRMRELAVQSANSTYSDIERGYLQSEASILQEEIYNVINNSSWNGKKLLDGSFVDQKIQVGANNEEIMDISIPAISIEQFNPLSGSPTWTKMISSSGSFYINAMVMSDDGYLYTAGIVNGSIDGQIAGQEDFALSKFDKNGNRIWSKLLGAGIGVDVSNAITIGQDGSIYVAGSTNGSLTDFSVNNENVGDVVIAKYTTDGALLWAKQMGTSEDDRAVSLSTGSDGAIYLTGTTTGSLDGVNPTGGDLVVSGQGDAFILKLDTNGDQIWLNQLSGSRFGNGVASGPDGSVYAVGTMDGTLNGVVSNGAEDAYVIKFNSDGTTAWTTNIGTPTNDLGEKVAVANNGDIYVTGSTYGTLYGVNEEGYRDTYLNKFTSDGVIQWSRQLNLESYNAPTSIFSGEDGDVFIGGWWPQDGTEQGGSAYVAQYSSTGVKMSVKLVANNYSFTNSLLKDGSNALYVAGISTYGVNGEDFNGPIDSFLLKYSQGFDISDQERAIDSISAIDDLINSVNGNRSTIGSYINRLVYAMDNATNMSTNLVGSRSSIMDSDYALEATNLAKNQIIQQAATAIMAQANQRPQAVLKLLQDL